MLFKFLKALVRIFMQAFLFLKVKGVENLPEKGPLMICANHKSMWDPFAIGVMLKRDISFMAKDTLFKNKLVGAFIRWVHGFPVKRGEGDLNSIKTVLKIFGENGMTMIFPEGTRIRKGKISKPKNGAVWLAAAAGVPILPIGIKGDYKLFGNTQLIIGKPIDMSKYKGRKLTIEEMDKHTKSLMEKIYSLAKG